MFFICFPGRLVLVCTQMRATHPTYLPFLARDIWINPTIKVYMTMCLLAISKPCMHLLVPRQFLKLMIKRLLWVKVLHLKVSRPSHQKLCKNNEGLLLECLIRKVNSDAVILVLFTIDSTFHKIAPCLLSSAFRLGTSEV